MPNSILKRTGDVAYEKVEIKGLARDSYYASSRIAVVKDNLIGEVLFKNDMLYDYDTVVENIKKSLCHL